ncbi:ulp1 protease family, C-terminal catalytic domain-containing protein [Tanacetum coccineum]
MTKASSIACVLGCNRVTKYVWLLEVMFEVGFRGVVSCGLPLTSLSASLVVTLVDVMSVNDEGVVSISITKPVVCRTDLDTSKRRSRSKISQQRITWVGTERRPLEDFTPISTFKVLCAASEVKLRAVRRDILPSRLARFVVTAFTGSTYEFKLEKSIIRVTLEKVHEILGVSHGGTSIFDLPETPLDDFVKLWFKQFGPKHLKDIRATDIAEKLVLAKRVDFMFKVNFLMLFANVMGTADTMKAIDLEIQEEVISKLELHGPWRESELHETEGFYEVGDNVIRTRTSLKPPTDKQCVCSLIEEKLKIISDEKAELENLLRKANTQFPNDEDVRELYDEYGGVFKETVFLEEEQVHVDDVHPASRRWETVFQTGTGPSVSSIRLNMETLAPRLWIDSNVVDCWVAILSHEELVKVDPSPKGIFYTCLVAKSLSVVELQTMIIILDNSDCGETCNSKYKGACELLKKIFSKYLCDNQHPKHDVVTKVKPRIPKLKWRTATNQVDCGFFAMIHMESYIGEPAARWDVGLCTESEKQVSLLRRMRFKIATNILLHELNIHSQKMFDLDFKFETENDEQTRISIIVNAIKNKAESDPVKNVVQNKEGDEVKNVVKNQEGDAVKSK